MATQWTRVLRKLDDYRWEIPRDYKPGMRVPGLVYADETMLRQIGQDQALEQVANVATLPGIVRHSLAMPDIHWGYGFPVGGVAAMRAEDGVISPGGIGFDINCLPGSTPVLHALGYHKPIAAFEKTWEGDRLRCMDYERGAHSTAIAAFITRSAASSLGYRLTTESGREIVATEDHPFYTPGGMVPLRDIGAGARVAVYPFEGVAYEEPGDEVLVTDEVIARHYPGNGNGLRQVLGALRSRGLLPLSLDHPALPYLIRLMGFVQGDGSLHFLKGGGSLLALYGEPDDLEMIRQDILAVGFVPSRIYTRRRRHRIVTRYGASEFERTESAVHCGSAALATLLVCLGATEGQKATANFDLPPWLDTAPLWMKRLYLAALFGAELAAPGTVTGHERNLQSPVLSMNKVDGCVEGGLRYLEGICGWLRAFGVSSRVLAPAHEYDRKDGRVSYRLRLQISSTPANAVRLWTRIGFDYNRRKHALANVASVYLRLKQMALARREESIQTARQLWTEGAAVKEIVAAVASTGVNRRFVERSLWGGRKTGVRIDNAFLSFGEFARSATEGLGDSGQVWERVIRKEPVILHEPVYDFTVTDSHHNFIAAGFVVSNCGVRLLRTDLSEEEVRPKLRDLVDALFRNIPSGVGSTGKVRVSIKEVDEVLRGGARWAVERGFGTQADLDSIEAGGRLREADPEKVSQRARDRGKDQLGTLGSGNHFLEIQVVDHIYDTRAAGAMGIIGPGQVLVFIHTGSRGLGYQICEDYLKIMDRAGAKYQISLPDRQLACAPFTSPEGQDYFRAMCCAANFAWANRQMITHWVRESFTKVLGQPLGSVGLQLVYDVAHNIAKLETYPTDGKEERVVVHRKGATRAFPPGHPEIPPRYRDVGQPVLIPGDMGRYSFVAVGTEQAMAETFGSTCHGAGRLRSRKAAVRELRGVDVAGALERRGIVVRAQNRGLLAEEASEAYKDVAEVVDVCHGAGISKKVARMRPIGVVKG